MCKEIDLTEFIAIGQHVQFLTWPINAPARDVLDGITEIQKKLAGSGLKDTAIIAGSLNNVPIRKFTANGIITGDSSSLLRSTLDPIRKSLYNEVSQIKVARIDTGAASTAMQKLGDAPSLTPTQAHLYQETVWCMERGAYRAAIVMGWNLAYDIMRYWVFTYKKDDFNNALTSNYARKKDSKPLYERIEDYEDFYSGKPDEWTVIDTMQTAKVISAKVRDELRQLLRRRNEYAHATKKTPTIERANAYIQDLIDIVTASPFNETPGTTQMQGATAATAATT